MFLSGSYLSLCSMCMGRCFIWTANDLDDHPRWDQGSGVVCHEEKKKEMKGLGEVKEGDRREEGNTEIHQAVLPRDLPKSSASSLARVKACWVSSHCTSKIP